MDLLGSVFASGLQKLYTDVDSLRDEGRWGEVISKIKELREVDPNATDERLRFYEGESVLQLTCDALLAQDYDRLYSGGNDDTSTNRLDFAASEPAADVVGNAVKDLEGVKASMTNEIWALLADIVLAKFHFLEERPDIALSLLTSAAMDTEVFLASTSPRAVRLVAEGFALKGLCMEAMHSEPTENPKISPSTGEVMTCYETATQLMAHYNDILPESGAVRSNTELHAILLGPILERAVVAYVDFRSRGGHGLIKTSLDRTRRFLRHTRRRGVAILRLEAATLVAESLLGGVNKVSVTPGTAIEDKVPVVPSPASDVAAPSNDEEELLLLLQIIGLMGANEIVLNRQAEYRDLRLQSIRRILRILNLTTIASLRFDLPEMLTHVWERTAAKCYDMPEVMLQYANVLVHTKKFAKGLRVLLDLLLIDANNRGAMISAAELCLEHLDKPKEGEGLALRALALSTSTESRYLPSLLIAIARSIEAASMPRSSAAASDLAVSTITMYDEACGYRDDDFRLYYNMALHQAIHGDMKSASLNARKCLELNDMCLKGWHLLGLVLSAAHFSEAHVMLVDVEENYDVDIQFYLTTVALMERMHKTKDALHLARKVLQKFTKPPSHSSDASADTAGPPVVNAIGSTECDHSLLEAEHPSVSTIGENGDMNLHHSNQDLKSASGDEAKKIGFIHSMVDSVVGSLARTFHLSSQPAVGVQEVSADMADGSGGTADKGATEKVLGTVSSSGGLIESVSSAVSAVVQSIPLMPSKEEEEESAEELARIYEEVAQRKSTSFWRDRVLLLEAVSEVIFRVCVAPLCGFERCKPKQVLCMAKIAELHLKLNEVEEAKTVIDEAEELYPECYYTEYVRGMALVAEDRDSEAKLAFETSVLLAPEFESAWLGLFGLAMKEDNVGLATHYLTKMRTFTVVPPDTLILSSLINETLEDEKEGMDFFEMANELLRSQPVRPFRILPWMVSI